MFTEGNITIITFVDQIHVGNSAVVAIVGCSGLAFQVSDQL